VKKIIGPVIIFIALVQLTLAGCTAQDSPQGSLKALQKAVKDHNAQEALRYIDVDAVVNNTINEFMERERATMPKEVWESMEKTLVSSLRTTMDTAMRTQLRTAVTDPDKDTSLLRFVTRGKPSDFTVKTEGDAALLTSKKDPKVKLKMTRTAGAPWRIVQFVP
jgi:hypothetical protein